METTQTQSKIKLGKYEIVALADSSGDIEIIHNHTAHSIGEVDYTICAGCNVNRFRNKVWILADEEGNQFTVGSSCVHGFTNVPEGVAGNALNNFTKVLAGERTDIADWIYMAILRIQEFGYEKRGQGEAGGTVERIQKTTPSDENRTPDTQEQIIFWTEEVIAWAANLAGDKDFENNLKKLAQQRFVTKKHIGLVAYMAEGYRREMNRWVKAVAQAKAREERVAVPTELLTGRHEISGTVIKTDTSINGYGEREVMTVEDDRGFQVWGTNNMDSQVGDRVTFTATVCVSGTDPTFGFFKRPTAVA